MKKANIIYVKLLLAIVFVICLLLMVIALNCSRNTGINCNLFADNEQITYLMLGEGQKEVDIVLDKRTEAYAGYNIPYSIHGRDCEIGGFVKTYSKSGENVWGSAPIAVGVYDVKITRPSDETYAEFNETVTGGLEITPKTIELMWTAPLNLEYDGSEKIPTVTVNGLLEGDVCNVEIRLLTGNDNVNVTKNGFAFESVSLDNANYKMPENKVSSKYLITPKEVTVDYTAPQKLQFDGNEKIPTVELGGILNNDNCDVQIELNEGDNINVTAQGFSYKALSLDNSNYRLPDSTISEIYLITPKEIILTITNIETGCEYDGNEKNTKVTYNDLIGTDTLKYELSYRLGELTTPIDAGLWTVTIKSAEIESGKAENYTLVADDIGEIIISKKSVKVQIVDVTQDNSFIYDGTEKATTVLASGLVGDDSLTANLDYKINGEAKTPIFVGEWSVSINTVNMVVGNKDNYEIDTSDVGVMVIAPKEIGLVWTSPAKLDYDATSKIPTVIATGLIENDICNVEISLVAGCDNINVTAQGFLFFAKSVENLNYKLPNNTISDVYYLRKKELLVTADDYSLTYGDEIPSYRMSFSGFVGEDDESDIDVLPKLSSRYVVGTSVINSGMAINVLSGTDNNYFFTYENGTISIKKKKVSVVADNASSVVEQELSKLTYKSSGIVNGDAFIGSLATEADKQVAGEYAICIGSLTINDNYEIEFTEGIYTVKRLSVSTELSSDISMYIVASKGINPEAQLFVETNPIETFEWFKLSQNDDVLTSYSIEIEGEVEEEDQYTVKFAVPRGTTDIKKVKVFTFIDGKQIEITPRMEGDSISFTTTKLGEFVVVQSKSDYRGIITASIIICSIFALFFLWYLIKRKRDFGRMLD